MHVSLWEQRRFPCRQKETTLPYPWQNGLGLAIVLCLLRPGFILYDSERFGHRPPVVVQRSCRQFDQVSRLMEVFIRESPLGLLTICRDIADLGIAIYLH